MRGQKNGWTDTDELDSFDCTLANLSELVRGCLDAAGATSVAEIGAEHGLFTEELLSWGQTAGAQRIIAVDPAPRGRLSELADRSRELELIVATSHDAIPQLELPDAMIIDGDHNHFTVSGELRLIDERAGGSMLPLLLLHDVGWPLGRRDSYHAPEQIPAESRMPLARDAFLVPDEKGVADRGLYYECTAAEEGGPGNGVLTAVDDFLAGRPELRFAIVAPFFGLGVVWHRDAPYADSLERLLAPWDRNPVLERVEEKRVAHLVAEFRNLQLIDALRSAEYELRFETISRLLPIERSTAFALAERISTLRQGGTPNFSRAELGRLLDELAGDEIELEAMGTGNGARQAPAESNGAAGSPAPDLGGSTASGPA